jgi:hypothetical protein
VVTLSGRSIGRLRRVNYGRNDTKMFLKNPEFRRFLRQATKDMEDGKGIHMSLDELREWLGIEP